MRAGRNLLLWWLALFVFALWAGAHTFKTVADVLRKMECDGVLLLDEHGELAEQAATAVVDAWTCADVATGDAVPISWQG